jgi:hypothetical protein
MGSKKRRWKFETREVYIGPPSITDEMIEDLSRNICDAIVGRVEEEGEDFTDIMMGSLGDELGLAKFWMICDVTTLDAIRNAPPDVLMSGEVIGAIREAVRESMGEKISPILRDILQGPVN